MKAYVITIRGHEESEQGYKTIVDNWPNDFLIERFDAVTPDTYEDYLYKLGVVWAYPHSHGDNILSQKTELLKAGYGGNPETRKACALSHYLLWQKCSIENTPLIVLEHDALPIKKLDTKIFNNCKYTIVGLNDPKVGTIYSDQFDAYIKYFRKHTNLNVVRVPRVGPNIPPIPNGLAGNSAYYITPDGARALLDLVKEYGLWNNDAIMCDQLLPGMLGVTTEYYTSRQNLKSTTMNGL